MASSASKAAAESYIGSYISLISKYEIRYEGILHRLNVQNSSISLQNVRCYGTEGRKKDGPQVPSSDKVFEFILFRGSDIKDLQVKSAPPAPKEDPMLDDPAIIQSHYAPPLSPSASVDGKGSVGFAQSQDDMPTLTSGSYPTSFTSTNHVASVNHSRVSENASQSYWQGYNGTYPHSTPVPAPPVASSSSSVQTPGLHDSPIMGLTIALESAASIPSSTSNLLHLDFSNSSPVKYPVSKDMPSLVPKANLPFSVDRLTTSSIPYSSEFTGVTNAHSINKDVSDTRAVHFTQSLTHHMSPYVVSTSSPLLMPASSLLTPDLLAQSTSYIPPSMLYPDQTNVDCLAPLPSLSQPTIPSPASQAPLLPVPGSAEKHRQSTMLFTEEFDFEAMNEKFKKDEVWGFLGKIKPTDNMSATEDYASDHSLEEKVAPHLVPNFDPKPAYKKDEFFDTISHSTLGRGRNSENRFFDRMKQDTETFGWSNQRPNMGYGSYGAGRGRHNWGRGYGYGGRGRGNLPF